MTPVRKVLLAGFTVLAAVAMQTPEILGANPHFVVGPTITTSNVAVTACGKIAGLGDRQQEWHGLFLCVD